MNRSRWHFMGIGGQGISAVAQMVRDAQGEQIAISGCDMQASATTAALEQAGVAVRIGHSAEHVNGIDRLIVVPAALVLNPDHPELATARARGVPIITWQEVLGELTRGKCLLSVSGVHGKGTTTALLALLLLDAGLDPTCEIGAIVPRFGANYRLGKSQDTRKGMSLPYFVNEADEYYHNFWHYHPRLAIVTSIEFEHPEYYAGYEDYLSAFEHFVRGMDMDGDWPFPPTLILNIDSPGCLQLRERLADWPGQIVTYAVEAANVAAQFIGPGTGEQPTFAAYDVNLVGETTFRVHSQWPGGFPADRPLSLQLPGIHNVQNALAALAAAQVIGIDAQVIAHTLANFGGLRRRFEMRNSGPITIGGRQLDVILVDDYAHHPTAIAATLAAARERFPGRRLVAVYQPHMFSRTKAFFEQFLTAFDEADVVIIADIFPARERDSGLISARDLVGAMRQREHFAGGAARVMHGGNVRETDEMLRAVLRDGDAAVIMGAGDIYTISEHLLMGGTEPYAQWAGQTHAQWAGQITSLPERLRAPTRDSYHMTFDARAAYAELHPHFGERVRRDEPLARHCTFGVGGPADLWVSLDSRQELIQLITLCAEQRWPALMVGNGTNILYADAGVRGIVARMALSDYTIEDQGDGTALLKADAGVSWPRLLNELAPLGWGGLEFGPGIPGTLGGGVISNAGAHNSDLSRVLEWVEVLDARDVNGDVEFTVPQVRRYQHDELDLSYRHSRFRASRRVSFDEYGHPLATPRGLIEPSEIITRLGIRLHREDSQQLKATIDRYKQHRKQTQPPQQSAGSVFKNPPGDFAGHLIEQAGLKGFMHGKAQISQRHANFIVNTGKATAADVAALIMEAHNQVRTRFGIELELEVELRGEWGEP